MSITRMSSLESPLLSRLARELGWADDTEIAISVDQGNSSIHLTRPETCCHICGSFHTTLYALHDVQVCDQCLGELGRIRLRHQWESYREQQKEVEKDGKP